ncbi:hypothetical protein L195_g047389, partial [Trifolium pratense]
AEQRERKVAVGGERQAVWCQWWWSKLFRCRPVLSLPRRNFLPPSDLLSLDHFLTLTSDSFVGGGGGCDGCYGEG